MLPFRGGSDYLIFLNSTEAKYKLDEYSDNLIPLEAKELLKKLIVVEKDKRLSIKELIEDKYFDSVREMKKPPKLNEWETKLKEHCQDFIVRGGVYKIDGVEKFKEYFQEKVEMPLVDMIEEETEKEKRKEMVKHVEELSIDFIFGDKD